MAIKDIPYRSLPNQPELFLRYLDLSPEIMRFYRHAPVAASLGNELRDSALGRPLRRAALAAILRRQNKSYGCGPVTLHGIDELEKEDCVAVLTGQQVGLFAGPLYTTYKALTAISVCRELKERGIRAVPVFWMETEDHDLAEVTHQATLNRDDTVHTFDFGGTLFGSTRESARPVGSIPFPDAIREVVRAFADLLPNSEWKEEIRALLEAAYCPGATFCRAFAQLLHQILPDSGLILFNPQDSQTKPLIADLFRWVLNSSETLHALLSERNREIESAGLIPQVRVPGNSTALFYIENGQRRLLERQGARFSLKNGDRSFSLDELVHCLDHHPERFSPSVLLRPVVQDTLFPTFAYVAGPAEVGYFAQAQVLYELRRLPMPVIWPRESFTLVEPGIRKKMQQLGIDIRDCFAGMQSLQQKVLRQSGFQKQNAELEALKGILEKTFSELERSAEVLDPSLPRAMDTAQNKILHNLKRLQACLLRVEENNSASAAHAANLILHHFLPNRNLQERELGILHFLSARGPAVLDTIRGAMRLSGFSHRILELE
jgi:bacillithiol biosynthesis cysteine-adding enzyme BshC